MKDTSFPKAPLGRIFVKAGASRVSAEALDVFADILEQIAEDISIHAIRVAKHAGRKTLQAEDIKIASRR